MDQPTASSLPYHLYTKKSSSSSLLVGTNSLFKHPLSSFTHTLVPKLKIQFSRSCSVYSEGSTDPSSRSDMRKGIREFPCRASEMGSLRLFCETFRLRLDFSPLDLSQPILANSLFHCYFRPETGFAIYGKGLPARFEPIFFDQWGESTEEPR